ncbi:MAG TPA: alkylhydroperoxidase [Flavobacteriia bacterium]|nr:alkylhydroperoxidase [Flavobacteriia bacterium]
MSWIKTINYQEATGKLKRFYDRIKGPDNSLDNVLTIHSLRPHSLEGHMVLYKNVLHHSGNSLPKWYLETLGTYVSHLNNCTYCVAHHSVGIKRNLQDDTKYQLIITAINTDDFKTVFDTKYAAGMHYAKLLTLHLNDASEAVIQQLRKVGFSDGEILEINQLVSYFNYVNRTVVGLGVSLEKNHIGLSPNASDDGNWLHK